MQGPELESNVNTLEMKTVMGVLEPFLQQGDAHVPQGGLKMTAITFFVDHKSGEPILWAFGLADELRSHHRGWDDLLQFAAEAHRANF